MSRTTIILACVTAIAALALIPSQASAATVTSRSSAEVTIPDKGTAGRYPSTVPLRNIRGPVTDVKVSLNGVYHTRPQDIDVLVQAPDGSSTILMSDACGEGDVSNRYWTFHSTVTFPDMGSVDCTSSDYAATNYEAVDDWPGVDLTSGPLGPLTNWHRKVMTGAWKLYVVDDTAGNSGTIANGWALSVTTAPVDVMVPATGKSGPADLYPAPQFFNAAPQGEIVTDVDVDLGPLAHDQAKDLDLLLVGPSGQSSLLMSDACGDVGLAGEFEFSDEAPFALQNEAGQLCESSGRFKPTDHDPGDSFPAPAPPGPYATSLSAFDYTDPHGAWNLYALDDDESGGDGYLVQRFKLDINTRPKAAVVFAQRAVQAAEGAKTTLTLTRSAEGDLGPASVTVATSPGSASAGADFKPLSQKVEFAEGQATRTVTLDVLEDRVAEGAETVAVTLGNPSGDAVLGAPERADVTIAADAGAAKVVRCGGKRATIVGTKRADVLRGTKRADVIAALAGSDTVRGARGNDLVCAGPGNDSVAGAAGRDRLLGAAGRDRLKGGAGRDTCLGGKGRDRAICELERSA